MRKRRPDQRKTARKAEGANRTGMSMKQYDSKHGRLTEQPISFVRAGQTCSDARSLWVARRAWWKPPCGADRELSKLGPVLCTARVQHENSTTRSGAVRRGAGRRPRRDSRASAVARAGSSASILAG